MKPTTLRYLESRRGRPPIWRKTSIKHLLLRMRQLVPNNVLPPRNLLNELFMRGSADTISGNQLAWKSFRLGVSEYGRLTYDLRKYFGPAPGTQALRSFELWLDGEQAKRMKRRKIVELRVGSEIRIKRVPKEDLIMQKKLEKEGEEHAGWTVQVLRAIIRAGKPVKIYAIDEYGKPWFRVRLKLNGRLEEHILAVIDNDSWALVSK